jgi:hypothetical protein
MKKNTVGVIALVVVAVVGVVAALSQKVVRNRVRKLGTPVVEAAREFAKQGLSSEEVVKRSKQAVSLANRTLKQSKRKRR